MSANLSFARPAAALLPPRSRTLTLTSRTMSLELTHLESTSMKMLEKHVANYLLESNRSKGPHSEPTPAEYKGVSAIACYRPRCDFHEVSAALSDTGLNEHCLG